MIGLSLKALRYIKSKLILPLNVKVRSFLIRYEVNCEGRVFINGPGTIVCGNQITLRNNVHLGSGYYLNACGGIYIGDNTHISRNLLCYSINHKYEGDCLPYDGTVVKKPVYIGKNVWIGMNVTIIPGITVGEGAILGMGCVVTKDVPKCAIVGGNPAKIIGYRDRNHYAKLESQGLYGGVNGKRLLSKQRRA